MLITRICSINSVNNFKFKLKYIFMNFWSDAHRADSDLQIVSHLCLSLSVRQIFSKTVHWNFLIFLKNKKNCKKVSFSLFHQKKIENGPFLGPLCPKIEVFVLFSFVFENCVLESRIRMALEVPFNWIFIFWGVSNSGAKSYILGIRGCLKP